MLLGKRAPIELLPPFCQRSLLFGLCFAIGEGRVTQFVSAAMLIKLPRGETNITENEL